MNFLDIVGFEWDSGNIHKNRLKHKVTTNECEEVFFNAPLVFFDDILHSSDQEKRYKVLGITSAGRKLALAVTIRNNKIRVIMSRNQSKKERIVYEEN
ncbi:MAG: BrnT family toxin [Pseudomonadota bacterium]